MACALTTASWSQNLFEKLVTPGPVIEGHVKYENDCSQCHEPFSRKSQTRLCLDCHKDIAADRRDTKGFHGRQPDAAKQECTQCHTDHKGRDADIMLFDRETFNHALTNFDLHDAHKAVQCVGCHVQNVKFRKAPSRCFDCHRTEDPHKARLGEACDSCHGEASWQRLKPYDHDKTKFPLRDAHRDVSCAACHVSERYKDIGTACTDCHRIQDVHGGRYGAKCETCHDQMKWKTVHFNHDKDTKFPLRAAHARITCEACHTGDLYRDKLQMTCVSCHRKDDRHDGQQGTKCEQCHGEDTWRHIVSFDHDLTRFPLIGRHGVVPCEECHQSWRYKDAGTACASCHRDDHHEGRLTPACALCHNPNAWPLWRFDHDTQTHYPLTGKHRDINCHACHVTKNVTKIVLAKDCYSCHQKDDVHRGGLGRTCERCHVTTSFTQVKKQQ
ncbi:MAG: cytochrome C [Bradyrhizobiaceae bacterium]|nr:cytochrome C [Bradyrhizobiaceae bacterium]